jgi:hypothetical protein
MKVKLHLYFYFVGDIMEFLKNEKWRLEEVTRRVCLLATIFYGAMIFFLGLMNVTDFITGLLPLELWELFEPVIGIFDSIFNFLIRVLLYISLILYVTRIIYVIPVIVAVFLISVAFIELVKRKNPRVFVHPLVLSSIMTSFAGTWAIIYFLQNSF